MLFLNSYDLFDLTFSYVFMFIVISLKCNVICFMHLSTCIFYELKCYLAFLYVCITNFVNLKCNFFIVFG